MGTQLLLNLFKVLLLGVEHALTSSLLQSNGLIQQLFYSLVSLFCLSHFHHVFELVHST